MDLFKKYKNDILLILAVLVLAGGIWLFTSLTRTPGAEIVVSVDGGELCRLPLDEGARMTIGEGERFNILVISGGEAYIEDAGCPDHVCVKSGSVSFDGETIVCLPHKLVISVVGGADSGLDGVAG